MTVAAPPRTNVLALVGFVAAFAAPPAGIILGAIALKQIKERGERGRGIAIADIWIGIAMCLFYLFFVVMTVFIVQIAGPTGTTITVS